MATGLSVRLILRLRFMLAYKGQTIPPERPQHWANERRRHPLINGNLTITLCAQLISSMTRLLCPNSYLLAYRLAYRGADRSIAPAPVNRLLPTIPLPPYHGSLQGQRQLLDNRKIACVACFDCLTRLPCSLLPRLSCPLSAAYS